LANINRTIWPAFSFGTKEHLTSTKLNNLATAMEYVRRGIGPYSLAEIDPTEITGAQYQVSITGMYLVFNENPHDLGFIQRGAIANPDLIPMFRIFYRDPSIHVDSGGYACWRDVHIQEGTFESVSGWRVRLTNTYDILKVIAFGGGQAKLISTGTVDFTTMSIENFFCYFDYFV
jgi:hypothetical protein